MNFHVMTLFPDMIMDGLNTSITGRAIKSGVMSVTAHDIRDYSNDKHLKVDDYPYGGGAGMVMRAGPVCDCYEDIVKNIGERPRVIYMTRRDIHLHRRWQKISQRKTILSFCVDIMKVLMREHLRI